MYILKQLNEAMTYIEDNLCAEYDLNTAARIACVSTDTFIRLFSYITGMTINEYIRKRKLSLASYDLRHSDTSIIDLAIKYGYNSTSAFSRAFSTQHGMSPIAYRKNGGTLKVYPPASFHIIIKGASEMNFEIIELPETQVYGISKPYDKQLHTNKEALRHIMWADTCENVPSLLCEGAWNQSNNTSYDGIWYGIWKNERYMIARKKSDIKNGNFEAYTIPAGTYASFKTERGALAWEEIPKLFDLIFNSWLPTSGYIMNGDHIIEIYHLWSDQIIRKQNRYYEVLVPINVI